MSSQALPTAAPTTLASLPTADTTTTIAPATTAPATTIAPTTVLAARSFSVAATGDILPHSPLWRQAQRNAEAAGRPGGFDYRPMFAPIAPFLRAADLAICHLETPIAPVGAEFSTAPYYAVQPEIVEAIADAGYDRCSTASNHAYDQGVPGIARTITVLEQHGVDQSGMATDPADIVPRTVDVNGIAVAHLSYTWSYNGVGIPDDQLPHTFFIDPERVVADARAARAAGAEVVIVSLHWGDEQVHDISEYQRTTADAITAPGLIDLVIGHHAHVLQPIERVNGTWVLFGTGNVLSNLPATDAWTTDSQDAGIFTTEITLDAGGDVRVARPKVIATWVDQDGGWVIHPVEEGLANGDHDGRLRTGLERSLARTREVLAPYLVPDTLPSP